MGSFVPRLEVSGQKPAIPEFVSLQEVFRPFTMFGDRQHAIKGFVGRTLPSSAPPPRFASGLAAYLT